MNLRRRITAAAGNADLVSAISILLLSFPLMCSPHAPWMAVSLAGLWMVLFIFRNRIGGVIKKCSGHPCTRFISPACACLLVFCFLVGVFLLKFHPHQWGSVIFADDYTPGYAASLKGLEALREGGLFGWDSRVLGGYYMVSEVPMNRALFLLPFAAAFGPQAGYHMMIMMFFCAFPLLSFAYAHSIRLGRNASCGAFFFAAIFLIGFLNDILDWGMIDALMGLDFFILNLILFERKKSGGRMAGFYLSVSLAASMYAHITFFLCSMVVFTIELLSARSKPLFRQMAAVCIFSFFMTLWYSFYFVYYHRFFISNPDVFDPSALSLADQFSDTLKCFARELNPFKAYLWTSKPESLAITLGCVLVYSIFSIGGRLKTIVCYLAVFLVLCCMQFQVAAIVTSRALYCVQFFLAILLGQFVVKQIEERRIHNLAIVLFFLTPEFSSYTYHSMGHIKSIRQKWPEFYSTMSSLDGNMVLLENIAHYSLVPDDPIKSQPKPVNVHWESLVSYETNKRLFCTTMEGYHYSIYRGNALNSGVFRGKHINRYSPDEIASVLSKWGIQYLVLWSENSRKYFSSAPTLFRPVRSVDGWFVFEFLNADPRGVVIANGGGTYCDAGYFSKHLYLKNVVKGDTAIIRQNYFPSWKAWYCNKKLPVINSAGQLAVIAPATGSYTIELTFPKYPIFSWVALFAVAASALWFGFGTRTANIEKNNSAAAG